MKKIQVLLALCLCCLFVNPLGMGQALAAEIKIGLMCPLTGKWASEGQDMKNIVSLLVDDVNKAGGIKGNTLKLVIEDDAGDPRSAALAAQKLASAGVVAVIGTYGSAVTEASQNILDEAGLVQIATGSTSVRLTEKGLTKFFRVSPRDDQQGTVAAKVIAAGSYKNVALLHDNSSYSKGLAQETRDELKKLGVTVGFYDALTPGERDYTAILTKLKAAKPDIVFFTGYYPETGMLLRQKAEMGWAVPMMGGDAANHQDLVKIAGKEAAKGYFFISPPLPQDLDSPTSRKFLESFQQAYKALPVSVWAVLAGDAFNVILAALNEGHTQPEAIAASLKSASKPFNGISGDIVFDKKGDRVSELYRTYTVNDKGVFVLQPK